MAVACETKWHKELDMTSEYTSQQITAYYAILYCITLYCNILHHVTSYDEESNTTQYKNDTMFHCTTRHRIDTQSFACRVISHFNKSDRYEHFKLIRYFVVLSILLSFLLLRFKSRNLATFSQAYIFFSLPCFQFGFWTSKSSRVLSEQKKLPWQDTLRHMSHIRTSHRISYKHECSTLEKN